jgi:hypothetical protein
MEQEGTNRGTSAFLMAAYVTVPAVDYLISCVYLKSSTVSAGAVFASNPIKRPVNVLQEQSTVFLALKYQEDQGGKAYIVGVLEVIIDL